MTKEKPQLSDQEIQAIFDYTSKKYIKFYDVQVELVDHIANRIEDMQLENPSLRFDQALHKVYKSFGVYGFTKVQGEKAAELQSYWSKKMMSYFYKYFKFPKIFLTLVLSGLIFMFLRSLTPYFADGLVIVSIGAMILTVSGILNYRARKKRELILTDKKLLVVQSYESALAISSITGITIIMTPFYTNGPSFLPSDIGPYAMYFFALYFSFMIISAHATLYVFPIWLQDELQEKYDWLDLDLSFV